MSDLFGVMSPLAADALNVQWGDTALANEFGTSAMASGTDSAVHTNLAMNTSPETARNPWSLTWSMNDYMNALGVPETGLLNPKSSPSATGTAASGWTKYRNIIGSVLLVVLGLIIFSKALGMFAEDGGAVIARFAKKGEA